MALSEADMERVLDAADLAIMRAAGKDGPLPCHDHVRRLGALEVAMAKLGITVGLVTGGASFLAALAASLIVAWLTGGLK